ncbi:hypothetical protein NEUTE1DRAFT_149072 [Neurospora tetrasperma FGSC 2508]|uniref:C2H2-type domain-containing protein n=1 Tax=Neurospora tetrasperma (strain FGSC 2508 / ATCC MYA-4615 / P0657) TaxID=510951 RepID=F8MW99_NEUT8|nr:uncharacterized protein NEUTE1DRAFT_149072 [Neurospora tetrasperma FGSC 2508]EGO54894.1 hypothetical protein NEUTE1DRAFT_149072 [Neurospora tetrasperma FGSC 2508]EGZ67613.1 hypothetical protein NEUTE2DRAFT_169476 [Neurospora tetrasperma FGSC 2509]
MSDHVDFLYMIPNGSASSSSQRAVGMESGGVEHNSNYSTNLSHTGDAFMTTPVSLLNAHSQRVATSPAPSSSGNALFPFTSTTTPHDLGCPIGSSRIDPALLQTDEDKGSHHLQMQEALALQAWHYQRFLQLCEDVKRIQSRIPNHFFAPSTTSAPAAYEQWTPSFPHGNHSPQTGNHCSTSSNDFPCNDPYPPLDSSNFMTWVSLQKAGNTFTHDSSLLQSQMDRGVVDIQMNGMSPATLSGNSTEFDLFTSIDQSSNGRGTSASETSVPPGAANAPSPSPERQEQSHTPATGPKSPSPSSSDRIPCPISTCGHTSATKRDMQRHIDDKHDDRLEDLTGTGWSLSPEMPCSYSGCTLKFRRKDRLKRHRAAGKHRR